MTKFTNLINLEHPIITGFYLAVGMFVLFPLTLAVLSLYILILISTFSALGI